MFPMKSSKRSAIVLFVFLSLSSIATAETTSSIDADFNNTPISAGNYIWFSSSTQVMGLGNHPAKVYVRNASVRFEASGITYTIPVPDSDIIFDPATTLARTVFNPAKNAWEVKAQPCCSSGNTFLTGAGFLVPASGFPGGVQNVKWQASYSTDTEGVKLHWKWAAAVYTCFETDYNALGVKPVDDDKNLSPRNKDNAGTPENVKTCVVAGARGAGGTNYTGDYSKTTKINLDLNHAPTVKTGGPYNGYVGKAIAFDARESSDPDGNTLIFTWDFGDGFSGTGATASHTYTSAGEYIVILTVSDGRDLTATDSTTVSIVLPDRPSITATKSPQANETGWNNSDVTITFECTDNLVGISYCPPPILVMTEGENQVFTGEAINNAGLTAVAGETVSLDRTQPAITQITVPEQISQKRPGLVIVEVSDNLGIGKVEVLVNDNVIATFIDPPYSVSLNVPEGAVVGSTLSITARVTDKADLSATSLPQQVPVVADVTTVIVGQVLSDLTSLPIEGATVQVADNPDKKVDTGAEGRYAISTTEMYLFLQISNESPKVMTVEREVVAQTNAGTVPVDARLTPIAAPVTIDAAGGTIGDSKLNVRVMENAVSAPTAFYLTRLSQQGLPGLLPVGWSPVAAFDLRADAAISVPFDAVFSQLPNLSFFHLAKYDYAIHCWAMVKIELSSAGGSLTVQLASVGSYALVVTDYTNAPIVPPEGQPLAGVDMISLPMEAVSQGAPAPLTVPPTGGTAMGSQSIIAPIPLPSGTILQTRITERYTLKTGNPIIPGERLQDIVFYQYPAPDGAALAATFPVTPSRTFSLSEFVDGEVNLDIMAGREGARGQTGGSAPLILTSGTATLSIAGGSLGQDTAISFGRMEALESFLPVSDTLTPLAEFTIDLSGQTLNIPAKISMPAAGLALPEDTLVLARIERIEGVPRLIVMSLAQVVGENIETQPYEGLSGIVAEGDYVFYRVASQIGFVGGIAIYNSEPVQALVQTDKLPFVSLASLASGNYIVATLPGTVNLIATVPFKALLASSNALVTAGKTEPLDLALQISGETATVTPPDGTVDVPITESVYITATKAFDTTTVNSTNIVLMKSSDSTPVEARFVLSQGNTMVAVVPKAVLNEATQYTLEAISLKNAFGAPVTVPRVTFTTRSYEAPVFSSNLGFTLPNANSDVQINAPEGSFAPGTVILIVNESNGSVVSLTVGNDGSVQGWIPATTSDLLVITITDPEGNQRTYTLSQFTGLDGSVAIGPGGGVVKGTGGVELRVPAGATDRGVVLKIEAFGPSSFADRPDFPDGIFGGGLKVESSENTVFKKEVKLAFPKPVDAPDGSFYYVYRRHLQENGTVTYETIDHAFVEGEGADAKVVTASMPFPGMIGGMFGLDYYFLMWHYDSTMLGRSSQGLISGYVRQVIPPAQGQLYPTYSPVCGATIYLIGGNSQVINEANTYTINGQCYGHFVLWDWSFTGGGTRTVRAIANGKVLEATAFEVHPTINDTNYVPGIYNMATLYANIGHVNIDFPADPNTEPTPKMGIQVFKVVDEQGNRTEAGGMIIAGTKLVFGINTNRDASDLWVQNVSITGAATAVVSAGIAPQGNAENLQFISDEFTPSIAGTYTVKAEAVSTLGGTPVSISKTFLVIADGGSNKDVLDGIAPDIITDLSYPADGSNGLQVNFFPQIVFTEPVVQVAGNVSLNDETGESVPLKISGVGIDGSGNEIVIQEVTADTPVTSITLQPLYGLKYSTQYTLTLSSQIVDMDKDGDGNPAPNSLKDAPKTIRFGTFGSEKTGELGDYYSAGVVVLDERAYAASIGYPYLTPTGSAYNFSMGAVHIFDISKAPEIKEVEYAEKPDENYARSPRTIPARPIDIVGVENSPVTNRNMIAVAANSYMSKTPSFVYFLDALDNETPPVGAAILTSNMAEGVVTKLAMLRDKAYAVTSTKGIQVIDIALAKQEFEAMVNQKKGEPPNLVRGVSGAIMELANPQTGAYRGSVTNTIPVTFEGGGNVPLAGIAADDFILDGMSQTLVVATGGILMPLIVADPQVPGTSALLYNQTGPIELGEGISLEKGLAITTGFVAGKHVAIVVAADPAGEGTGQEAPIVVLVVFDMTNPRLPQIIGHVVLDADSVGNSMTVGKSITIVDDTVYVGADSENGAIIVSLKDLTKPVVLGTIDGFGGRVAISENGFAYSADPNRIGVQTATLGPIVVSIEAMPEILLADENNLSAEDLVLNYQILGDLSEVESAKIIIKDENDRVVLDENIPPVRSGQYTWKAGKRMNPTPHRIEFTVYNPDGGISDPYTAMPEIQSGAHPTPVINLIAPARIEVGAVDAMLTITGRNYTLESAVVVERTDTGESLTLSPQYLSNNQLQVALPSNLTAQIAELSVKITNQTECSNDQILRIVQDGLPPAPMLSSIDPAEITASADPVDTWVTLNGANFIDGDSIVVSNSMFEEPAIQFVSSNIIRVLIPADWQESPKRIDLHVKSAGDSSLVSQSVILEILNDGRFLLPPQKPEITFVNDGFVPLAPPTYTASTIPIQIHGNGFQPGAFVVARVNNKQQICESQVQGSGSMQAQMPTSLGKINTYKILIKAFEKGQRSLSISDNYGDQRSLMVSQENVTFEPAERDTKNLYAEKNAGFHYNIKNCMQKYETETVYEGTPALPVVKQVPYLYCNDDPNIVNPPSKAYVHLAVSTKSANATNTVMAALHNVRQSDVSFRFDNSLAIANPPTANGNNVGINIAVPTSTPNVDQLLTLNAILTDPSTRAEKNIGTLNVRLIPPRRYAIYLHFVAAKEIVQNSGGTTTTTRKAPRGTPELGELITYKNKLQIYLNQIYKSLNVQFTVNHERRAPVHNNPDGVSEWSNYDQTLGNVSSQNDNKLEVIFTSSQVPSSSEVYTLLTELVPPDPSDPNLQNGAIDNNGNIQPNMYDKEKIHIFMVDNIKTLDNYRTIMGIALTGFGYAFVRGNKGEELFQTIAHELGHVLQMLHNHECNTSEDGCSDIANLSSKITGEVDGNPNATLPYTNTDFWDGSSVMYRDNDSKRKHFGAIHWRQLSQERVPATP